MKVNNHTIQGGVIISYERHSHGVVQLLTFRMRSRLRLWHYAHPHEIDLGRQHDFIIVFSLEDLTRVIKVFRRQNCPVPLVIHIDTPDTLAKIPHTALFPGVEIVPLPHGLLSDDPEDTLKLTLFREIIEHLEARAG